MDKQINKDMFISDIISVDRGVIPILLNAGLHCVGCASAQGETLEEAGTVHAMDVNQLVDDINAYLKTI